MGFRFNIVCYFKRRVQLSVPSLVAVLAPAGARLIALLAPAGARVGASLGSAPRQEQSLELRLSCVLWFDFGSQAGNLVDQARDLNSPSHNCIVLPAHDFFMMTFEDFLSHWFC